MSEDEYNRLRSWMAFEYHARRLSMKADRPSWDDARSIAMLVLERHHNWEKKEAFITSLNRGCHHD